MRDDRRAVKVVRRMEEFKDHIWKLTTCLLISLDRPCMPNLPALYAHYTRTITYSLLAVTKITRNLWKNLFIYFVELNTTHTNISDCSPPLFATSINTNMLKISGTLPIIFFVMEHPYLWSHQWRRLKMLTRLEESQFSIARWVVNTSRILKVKTMLMNSGFRQKNMYDIWQLRGGYWFKNF